MLLKETPFGPDAHHKWQSYILSNLSNKSARSISLRLPIVEFTSIPLESSFQITLHLLKLYFSNE
jgi:hypothetical protein